MHSSGDFSNWIPPTGVSSSAGAETPSQPLPPAMSKVVGKIVIAGGRTITPPPTTPDTSAREPMSYKVVRQFGDLGKLAVNLHQFSWWKKS